MLGVLVCKAQHSLRLWQVLSVFVLIESTRRREQLKSPAGGFLCMSMHDALTKVSSLRFVDCHLGPRQQAKFSDGAGFAKEWRGNTNP